jgi:dipeptidyl aminopeptidase/acylaminoacyl peptidase
MFVRAVVSAFAALVAFTPAWASPPPLEAYGRLPVVEDIELSPEGDRVAFITVDGENRQLVVQRLDGRERYRLNAGQGKVRDIAWAGADHVLIQATSTGRSGMSGLREFGVTVAFNLKTRKSAVLLDNTPDTLPQRMGSPVVARLRGETVVVAPSWTTKGGAHYSYDLYRVDLDTGRGAVLVKGGQDVSDWLVGPDGTAEARVESNDVTGRRVLQARAGAGWRTFLSGDEDQPVGLGGLGRKPGTAVVGKREGDHWNFYEADLATGALGAPMRGSGGQPTGIVSDPATHRPIGLSYMRDKLEYEFFDPAHQRTWRSAVAPFKGSHVALESLTPDFRKLVIKVEGAADAETYYLVDTVAKKADLLADGRPNIPPEALGTVRWITYKAADGLEIPAYLTLPHGRADARGLPLVVFPHGGPEARDAPGFDWWAQAFAARGYAVLQPQFRGSEGFGRKFTEAGHGQWGRKMQTDLSDGVRHLAAQGVVDPKRVCIMGASYGGYAAMAGITLDPGVYRCSVAVAGVGDPAAMLESDAKDAGRRNSPAVRYWSKFLGTSFRKRAELDAIAPTRQAAKAYAPILVMHGKDDTVVYHQQSVDFVRALQAAGKPVEFVTLDGEDHWLSRGSTRLNMLQRAVAFVEKHNPPN